MSASILPYIIPLLLAVLVLRRSSKARTVKPGRMWIVPVILVAMALSALIDEPFPGLPACGLFVVATLGGACLGYLRANHQHLTIDPKTGKISSQATTFGTFLVLALFAVRFGLKSALPDLANHGHADAQVRWGANALLLFTVAMMVVQTVLLWSRTRPLLAARAARTLDPAPTPPPAAASMQGPAQD